MVFKFCKMLKSPLRYPGGKSRAVGLISSIIPNYQEYREPFVGGGSVFFNQKQINVNAKFWINDLYEPLYIFWKEAQEEIHGLIGLINNFKFRFSTGKELFFFLRENYSSLSTKEKAAAFFIFNRITFSGTSDSGGYSEGAYMGRFTPSSISRLLEVSPLLRNTVITNLDYAEVVGAPGNDVFIFLDPPYYSATKSALYGKNGNLHKSFDHVRFLETMKVCPHKWLITYDDCEYIRDLFSFANIVSWDLKYGMRNVSNGESNQVGKELLIANFDFQISEKHKDYSSDTLTLPL